MPTLTIPNTFSANTTIASAEVNANNNAIATLINSTKLDSTNIQTGGVNDDNLAANAVTTSKIASGAVTGAKLASSVADGTTLELSGTSVRIKDTGVSTAKLADASVTQAKRAALGQQVSSSCGNFTTTNFSSFVDVTNLSVSITTTGRPVKIEVIADGNGSGFSANFGNIGSNTVNCIVVRDSTEVARYGAYGALMPSSSVSHFDVVAAGTYAYKIQLKANSGDTAVFQYSKLVAYEL